LSGSGFVAVISMSSNHGLKDCITLTVSKRR
jgi:hypothetical protein